MKNKKFLLHSLGHAVLVFLYTSGVAWILFNGERIFGDIKNFFGPVLVLLLFVLSATIVGTLVLGRPALLYFNGSKGEAFKFLGYTIMWIFVIIILVLAFNIWR